MELPHAHEEPKTEPLKDLARFVAQGVIPNAEEIAALRKALLEDHVVDREEADMLFNIKHKVDGIERAVGFTDLFIDAITSHLLYTGETPGVLDNIEYLWLEGQFIDKRDHFDPLDKALLTNIKMKAESVPANFTDLMAKFR